MADTVITSFGWQLADALMQWLETELAVSVDPA